VLDGEDDHSAMLGVDAIDDAVVAAPGAVQPLEFEAQRVADSVRLLGKRAVDELNRGGGDLFREPPQ